MLSHDDYVDQAVEKRNEDFEAVRVWVFDHADEVLQRYACLLTQPVNSPGYRERREQIADAVEADQCRMCDDFKGSAWVQEEAAALEQEAADEAAEEARDRASWGTGNPYEDACEEAARRKAIRDELAADDAEYMVGGMR